jgi:hypothetical protein
MLGGSCSSCCGGWYCDGGDESCACPTTSINSVTVSITATDFLAHAQYRDISNTPWYGSYLHMISRLNGTHSLTASGSTKAYWTKKFSPVRINQGGCVLCPDNGDDIKVSFDTFAGRTDCNITLCSYWSSIATTGTSAGGTKYFSQGDAIRLNDRTWTFGQYASVAEDNTSNPDRLASVRDFIPSAAFCWLFSSQCVNGQRQWSPPIPSTISADGQFGGALFWRTLSTSDSTAGSDSLTLNSVTISY